MSTMASLRKMALGLSLLILPTCSESNDGNNAIDTDGPLYLLSTNITIPDGNAELIWVVPELTTGNLSRDRSLVIPGGASADYFDGNIYIGQNEKKEIQRFDVTSNGLEGRESINFADRGITWIDPIFVSTDRAFAFADQSLQLIEWNPTTMTITKSHDFGLLKKVGWSWEWRDSVYRESDGKLFFYFAYTNDRTSFLNEFTVGVFDTKSNELSILTDTACPSSAGFGGYIDENNDFYAFADNFGLFTQVGNAQPKKACILRVKNGENTFDASYRFHPTDVLDGKVPWGYYYLGKNLAFTSVVDMNQSSNYESVFGFLFAPIHSGALINTTTNKRIELPELPLSGVGFQPYGVDDALLVSRTSGTAKDNEGVENTHTVVYRITGTEDSGKTEALFEVPGFVGTIKRIR